MAKATENATAEADKKAAGAAETASPAKGGKMKMILIAVVVLALVGGAMFGGMMMGRKQAAGQGEAPAVADVTDEIGKDVKGEHGAEAKEEKKEEAKAEGGHGAPKAEGGHGAPAEAASEDEEESLEFAFDQITTNLYDPNLRNFVRATIHLEASSAEALKAIEANRVPLRDATIMLFGTKTQEEVSNSKERLKRELLTRYEGIVEPKAISNIYFSEIMVVRQQQQIP